MGHLFEKGKANSGVIDYSNYLRIAPHAASLVRSEGRLIVAVNQAFEKVSGYMQH